MIILKEAKPRNGWLCYELDYSCSEKAASTIGLLHFYRGPPTSRLMLRLTEPQSAKDYTLAMNTKFIFADFGNAEADGAVRLTNAGTLQDLADLGIELRLCRHSPIPSVRS